MSRILRDGFYGSDKRDADSGKFNDFVEILGGSNAPSAYEYYTEADVAELQQMFRQDDKLYNKAWLKQKRLERREKVQNIFQGATRKLGRVAITTSLEVLTYASTLIQPSVLSDNGESRPHTVHEEPSQTDVDARTPSPTQIALHAVEQQTVYRRHPDPVLFDAHEQGYDGLDAAGFNTDPIESTIVSAAQSIGAGRGPIVGLLNRAKDHWRVAEASRNTMLTIATGIFTVASIAGGLYKQSGRNS